MLKENDNKITWYRKKELRKNIMNRFLFDIKTYLVSYKNLKKFCKC